MSMRKIRAVMQGPAGRWILLGIVLVILVIFTVTDDIVRALSPKGDSLDPRETAGSFSVLPGERIEVSYVDFDVARRDYGIAAHFFSQSAIERIRDTEVWTHLVLLEAAKREGITVSWDEVARFLRQAIRPMIWDDKEQYKRWVRQNYGTSPASFETAIRNLITTGRVRALYGESYLIGPPATREEMVKQYASQRIEYARGHVATLDARGFLRAAEDELKAESDPDAKLKDFFAKDPGVKNADLFRHPRRYVIELMYTIHGNVRTEEDVQRIVTLFARTYPELDVSKLEANVKDMKDFFGIYRDRLLEQEGSSWGKVQEEFTRDEEAPPDEGGDKEGGDEAGEPTEPNEEGKEEEKEETAELDPAVRRALFEHAFSIVKDQVARELKVRGMFQWFHAEARRDESKSLEDLFAKLRKHDDQENPVCATEPGQGLIVYREFPDGLTGDALEEIEDSGVKFTHNFRARITQIGDTDLPKVSKKADVLGMAGHGRMIARLLEVKRESRKTFEEMTEGDKTDLRQEYYIPANARARAREKLQVLRQRCIDEQIKPEDFRAEASKIGCRVHENEWIEASYDFMAEPEKSLYWPDEYLHMRDRYFLHKNLAGVLGRDRTKQELKAGSYLEVQVDARDDAKDPGACYLFLLLERRRPDASTVPPSEIDSFLSSFRGRRISEERDRWGEQIERLMADFDMEFYDDMQRRIDDELRRRREAKRRKAR
ncbi:MAG: SurA N-terminal domain-containing protein [Planctomycetota bacterium]|jgi:hypothetical protein